MSARRWFGEALLFAALGMTAGVAGPSHDAEIVARVGGNLAGQVGDILYVPITVDLTGAPGVRLGGYLMTVRYNPNVLRLESGSSGTFAPPLVNEDSAFAGVLRLTATQTSGADGVVTLAVGRFVVQSDTGASDLTISFEEMSGVGPTFDDLLPLLTVVNGSFCHAAGKWGDVDGDGQANSRDALIALSKVVGIPLDTLHVDTLVGDVTTYDTTVTLRPGLADVDADGQVTSRDALIIVSYAVGLPVPGFRIGLAAAGACGSGLGITLAITPDTLELQTGQTANVVVTGRDGTGQPMSLSGATWTSSNTAVAGVLSPGFGIEARDPGVAILTVHLGAGYRASMVVQVIAHRAQWFADAMRSQASMQTGSQAFPFAFIGDALNVANDGDTVHVAPGTYEETVWSDIAVSILGDTATDGSRPTIDARGYPYYDAWSTKAVQLGSRPGLVRLQNLRIVGGGVLVGSHDLVVRNVRIDAPGAQDVFVFAGPMSGGAGSAPAALRPAAADIPVEPAGKALIDGLYVAGYQETGIVAIGVDSVVIRNSAAIRDAVGTAEYCYPTSLQYAGIAAVYINSSTELRDNTVTNAPCSAIRVLQLSGRALISHNRIIGALAGGIVGAADTVALDHNVVRDVRRGSYGESVGIGITSDVSVRMVTSLGDSVSNVGQRGFAVDTTNVGIIDSLVVDHTGQDLATGLPGVELRGGRYTLRDSHISNTQAGVGVLLMGSSISLESRRNLIESTGAEGIFAFDPCHDGCETGPPVLVRAPPARASQSSSVSDTLRSIGDTLRNTGGSAILFGAVDYALVDSADVDGVTDGAGVSLFGVRSAIVRRSSIRNTGGLMWGNGIAVQSVDTVAIDRVAVSDAAVAGIYLEGVWAAGKVYGSTVDDSHAAGLLFFDNGAAPLTVDSSRFSGNAGNGIDLVCMSCAALGAITRTSITGNAGGVSVQGGSSGPTVTLAMHHNTIAGNTLGGAWNLAAYGVAVEATDNYWGDPLGPTCNTAAGVTGCDPGATVGDSIMTGGVTFSPWLDAPFEGVMTTPPAMASAPRPHLSAAALADRRAATRAARAVPPLPTPRPRMAGAAVPPNLGRNFTPQVPWQRGRPPRPATVHHPQ